MHKLTLDLRDGATPANATDTAFRVLLHAIVTLRLPPGTKVSEVEIARQLQMSRQPVRDAFFRLSTMGFLLIRPQRATLITTISDEHVMRAVFVRTALEVACIRAAVDAITETDLDNLATLVDRQAIAVKGEDRATFMALDDAFHREICRIGGHAYAWPLIDAQKGHMDRARILSLIQTSQTAYDEHLRILEALRARDPVAAADEQTRHIHRIVGLLSEIRAAQPQYFD